MVNTLFEISDGSPRYGNGSYDPLERIWRWVPAEMGPHEQAKGMMEGLRKRVKEEGDMVFYVVSGRRKSREGCMEGRRGGGSGCQKEGVYANRGMFTLVEEEEGKPLPLYPPPPPSPHHLDNNKANHVAYLMTTTIPPSIPPA